MSVIWVEDDEIDLPWCPMCGGQGYHLGTLGKFEWFRCRDCGFEFEVSPE